MGKGGGGSAPSPDPRIGEAALKQANLGDEWLSFARDSFKVSNARQNDLDALTKRVTEQQMGIASKQAGMADWQFAQSKEDRDRWEKKGIPAQDAFAKEANEYASPAQLQKVASEAQATMQGQTAVARDQARREASAQGIAPGSGRYAGIDRAGELGTAQAVGGAMNMARNERRDKALALKADVANMYSGLPAQSAAATQLGLGAGSSAAGIGAGAVGMNQGNQQLFQNSTSIMGQGFGGAMQGQSNMATTLSNLYGLNLDKWKTQQEIKSANTTGMFQALGTGIGAVAMLSDPKSKTNVKSVKKGKALEAVKKMPVKSFDYKPGRGDGGKGHVGPMADTFAKATGQKDTGVIRFQDAIGISMKAIQDLDHKVDKMSKALGVKGRAKPKNVKPKERRASQSPAKARAPVKLTTVKAAVKPQTYGIRR